ncbi:MAG: DUF4446 family protein [Actinomycetota bacterium]
MLLDDRTLAVVAVVGLLLAVVALGMAVFALRRKVPAVPPLEDKELRDILEDQANALHALEQAARALHGTDQRQQGLIEEATRHVALVRYDAFEDVGGRLSFSCALLDDDANGVVVTSINGRQDTRVYAKPIVSGTSSFSLSVEEEDAIAQAMTPKGRGD